MLSLLHLINFVPLNFLVLCNPQFCYSKVFLSFAVQEAINIFGHWVCINMFGHSLSIIKVHTVNIERSVACMCT